MPKLVKKGEEKKSREEVIDNVLYAENEVFEKAYTYRDYGVELNVKFRMPSARDEIQAQLKLEQEVGGSIRDPRLASLYHLLILMDKCDIGTTVFSLNDSGKRSSRLIDYFSLDNNPSMPVVEGVAIDFLNWFRGYKG